MEKTYSKLKSSRRSRSRWKKSTKTMQTHSFALLEDESMAIW